MSNVQAPRDLEAPRDAEVPREIKIKASDGWLFSVPRNEIAQSITITTIIQNLGLDTTDDPEPIQLDNVDGRTLRKVLEWCHQHVEDPVPTDNSPRWTALSQWDTDFIRANYGQLNEIIWAAHNLDIKGLTKVCCKAVADMIKGRSSQQIRDFFGFRNDPTANGGEANGQGDKSDKSDNDNENPFLRQGTSGS